MLLRNYILAYFTTEITDPRDTLRLNIPMDRGDYFDSYIHTAALIELANHGFTFTKFYAVVGKTTTDITDKVKEEVNEILMERIE